MASAYVRRSNLNLCNGPRETDATVERLAGGAMPGDPCPSLLRSPRTNLRALLERGGASRSRVPDDLSLPPPLDAALDAAVDSLIPADAENKLFFRKLYLVLDLDETLVYSQRMEPGAKPVGTQIFVRGHPFDMVPRPGLQHFLRTAHQQYVVYLYTMGDQEYTEAVLRVIDPEGVYFQGAPLAHPARLSPSAASTNTYRASCSSPHVDAFPTFLPPRPRPCSARACRRRVLLASARVSHRQDACARRLRPPYGHHRRRHR